MPLARLPHATMTHTRLCFPAICQDTTDGTKPAVHATFRIRLQYDGAVAAQGVDVSSTRDAQVQHLDTILSDGSLRALLVEKGVLPPDEVRLAASCSKRRACWLRRCLRVLPLHRSRCRAQVVDRMAMRAVIVWIPHLKTAQMQEPARKQGNRAHGGSQARRVPPCSGSVVARWRCC